jgi:hypothetical protein
MYSNFCHFSWEEGAFPLNPCVLQKIFFTYQPSASHFLLKTSTYSVQHSASGGGLGFVDYRMSLTYRDLGCLWLYGLVLCTCSRNARQCSYSSMSRAPHPRARHYCDAPFGALTRSIAYYVPITGTVILR